VAANGDGPTRLIAADPGVSPAVVPMLGASDDRDIDAVPATRDRVTAGVDGDVDRFGLVEGV